MAIKQVKCLSCGSRGTVSLSSGVNPCSTCGGTGKVTVKAPAKKCPRCKGTTRDGWRRCTICQGSGWAGLKSK